jgi:uncharacterized membrane protein YgdD (TMEM256/DUF423 family)
VSWRKKYLQIITAIGCLIFLVGAFLYIDWPWRESGAVNNDYEFIGLGCLVTGAIVMLAGWLLMLFRRMVSTNREGTVKYGKRNR